MEETHASTLSRLGSPYGASSVHVTPLLVLVALDPEPSDAIVKSRIDVQNAGTHF